MGKSTRINERKCRKNIAQMLSLMGFKDNNIAAAVTVRNMLAKLRAVEEINTNKFPTTTVDAGVVHKNKNRSTNKRLVLKFGGKRCVLDQELPSSVIVPLEPPHSKTLVLSCNKNTELKDSRNINPSCSSRMMIVGDDHEDDVIMELKNIEILDSRKNVGCSKNPNYVEKYSRNNMNVSSQSPSTSSSRMNVGDDVMMEFKNGDVLGSRKNTVVVSENPFIEMIIHNELRVYNVKDFIASTGGTKAKLFIEKKLTNTDVTESQGRLLMPALQLVDKSDNLLTSNEKMIMKKDDNKLSVTVFDLQRRRWDLNLGQWKMGSNSNYVLKTKWFPLVVANGLKVHMLIQVWSFRDVEENPCFAVVRI